MLKSNRLTALIFGTAIVALSASPLMAQDAPAPGGDTPATSVPAPASPTEPSQTLNDATSGSETQIPDQDVFGFDISGTTELTAEQVTAAKNTCNDTVNPNAVQYSANVRSFCERVLQMN